MNNSPSRPDPRDLGAYTVADAARMLGMEAATLGAWVRRRGRLAPMIRAPGRLLSFRNLVEAHVLDGLRRTHRVPMGRIRTAIRYLEDQLAEPHPLASGRFQTDGLDLFVEHLGTLVSASRPGQVPIRQVIERYLSRVEMGADGPVRFYPFSREDRADPTRIIVIDPRVAFGRPVVQGTGVPIGAIVSRFRAGEAISALAVDYGIDGEAVEEAIRCRDLAA